MLIHQHKRLREENASGEWYLWGLQCMMNELNGKWLLAPLAGQKSISPPKHALLFNSNINLHVTYEPRNDVDGRCQILLFSHSTYLSNTLLSRIAPYWINRRVKSSVTLTVTYRTTFWPAGAAFQVTDTQALPIHTQKASSIEAGAGYQH